MAFTAQPYWSGIGGRFSALRQPNTIGSVQTALLSLAYNRGAPNPALAPLEAPLAAGRWPDVADLIDHMQQEQPTSGIATRTGPEGPPKFTTCLWAAPMATRPRPVSTRFC